MGVIKINFDATFQSDSRTSTSAVIARYYKGEYVGVETYLFNGVVDAFMAEARACERALLFAINMGFRHFLVEGDSLTVINKLKAKKEDRSIIRPIIHHIHHLEKCFEEIAYLFVPRWLIGWPIPWRWKKGEDNTLGFGLMKSRILLKCWWRKIREFGHRDIKVCCRSL